MKQDAVLGGRQSVRRRGWKAVMAGVLAFAGLSQLHAPALAEENGSAAQGQGKDETAAPAASESQDNRRLSELAEQIARQQAEIAALQAKLEKRLDEESAARQAADAKAAEEAKAAVDAALKQNPRVAGVEGLTLSGFMQADMYVKQSSEDQLNTSTGAPLNDDRFTIRRARLRASIDRRYLAGIAEIDANTTSGAQVRPLAMEATIKLPGETVPYVAATVGMFKIPFGYEIGQSDYNRLFAERSNLERALFPGEYDLGARVSGGWRYVRYALAVQNGEPLGESTFPARDPNAAKDVSGRLGATASLGGGVDIQGGFSGLVGKGFHKGTSPTKATVQWKDTNEDGRIASTELVPVSGSSGLPSANFDRHAVGADLLVSVTLPKLGATTAYGEITWARNLDRGYLIADPLGSLGRDMRERGYYLALVQDLGQHAQVGVRYDYYDPDQDSTDRVSGTILLSTEAVSTVGIAAAGRWKIGGLTNRLLFQYDVNRNHLGRDAAGLPTNLKSNAFTMRAETVF